MRSHQKDQDPQDRDHPGTLKRGVRYEIRHEPEQADKIPAELKQRWLKEEMEEPERWDGMS